MRTTPLFGGKARFHSGEADLRRDEVGRRENHADALLFPGATLQQAGGGLSEVLVVVAAEVVNDELWLHHSLVRLRAVENRIR